MHESWTSQDVVGDIDLSLDGLSGGPVTLAWGTRSGPTYVVPVLYRRRQTSWAQIALPQKVTRVLAATSDTTGKILVLTVVAGGRIVVLTSPPGKAWTSRTIAALRSPLAIKTRTGLVLVGMSGGTLNATTVSSTGVVRQLPTLAVPGAEPGFLCAGKNAVAVGLESAGQHSELATYTAGRWSLASLKPEPDACIIVHVSAAAFESPEGGYTAELVSGTQTQPLALPALVAGLAGITTGGDDAEQLVTGEGYATPVAIMQTRDAATWKRYSTPSTGPAARMPIAVALDGHGNPLSLTVDGHGTWTYNQGHAEP